MLFIDESIVLFVEKEALNKALKTEN